MNSVKIGLFDLDSGFSFHRELSKGSNQNTIRYISPTRTLTLVVILSKSVVGRDFRDRSTKTSSSRGELLKTVRLF